MWVPAAFPPSEPEYRWIMLSFVDACRASRPTVANRASEILSLAPSEEVTIARTVASLTLSACSDAAAVGKVGTCIAVGVPLAVTAGPLVLLELLVAGLMLAAGRETVFVQLAPAAVGSLAPLREVGCDGCSAGSAALEEAQSCTGRSATADASGLAAIGS